MYDVAAIPVYCAKNGINKSIDPACRNDVDVTDETRWLLVLAAPTPVTAPVDSDT
jgi:hypothetical protein